MIFSLIISQLKWLYNSVDLFEMINYVWFELCNKLIVHDIIKNVYLYIFDNSLFQHVKWWSNGKNFGLWPNKWRFKSHFGHVLSLTSS